ncbi:hypothetical protein P389DRAFT_37994 [Cystobasidium minutum MCA 4210]|uniref:uncharacterized protein n=1 Tax=Cystobasidium minutum MCA 4210 TaxID=1397322 RepID=UPI0034CED55A|eukprot:jgi/Rhomi1/37994/CE37993_606
MTIIARTTRLLSVHAPASSTARWQSTASKASRAVPAPPKASWRLRRKYIFPILLFSAVSSLAINVRNAKDDLRILEDQHAAQLSVLKDLINRMVVGESVTQAQLLKEYERVGIIKRKDVLDGKPSQHISWREMIFGRKKDERDLATEKRELADIEHVLNQAAETEASGQPAPSKVLEQAATPPTAFANPPVIVEASKSTAQSTSQKRQTTVLI